MVGRQILLISACSGYVFEVEPAKNPTTRSRFNQILTNRTCLEQPSRPDQPAVPPWVGSRLSTRSTLGPFFHPARRSRGVPTPFSTQEFESSVTGYVWLESSTEYITVEYAVAHAVPLSERVKPVQQGFSDHNSTFEHKHANH
jgi:hypothetical protein